MLRPEQQLRIIKGPTRYAWWHWWITRSVRAYEQGLPSWFVNLLGGVAGLERYTR